MTTKIVNSNDLDVENVSNKLRSIADGIESGSVLIKSINSGIEGHEETATIGELKIRYHVTEDNSDILKPIEIDEQ